MAAWPGLSSQGCRGGCHKGEANVSLIVVVVDEGREDRREINTIGLFNSHVSSESVGLRTDLCEKKHVYHLTVAVSFLLSSNHPQHSQC
jgi:hypothetical protein